MRFWEAVDRKYDGKLSKNELGKITREIFGDENRLMALKVLVENGWLNPLISEGREKVGYYSLTETALDLLVPKESQSATGQEGPPNTGDNKELAVRVAELQDLVARIPDLEKQLERARKAREVLEQMFSLLE